MKPRMKEGQILLGHPDFWPLLLPRTGTGPKIHGSWTTSILVWSPHFFSLQFREIRRQGSLFSHLHNSLSDLTVYLPWIFFQRKKKHPAMKSYQIENEIKAWIIQQWRQPQGGQVYLFLFGNEFQLLFPPPQPPPGGAVHCVSSIISKSMTAGGWCVGTCQAQGQFSLPFPLSCVSKLGEEGRQIFCPNWKGWDANDGIDLSSPEHMG